MLPQLEPDASEVIWPEEEMTEGLQLQRGSLKRFQPMMVGSSCVTQYSSISTGCKSRTLRSSKELGGSGL